MMVTTTSKPVRANSHRWVKGAGIAGAAAVIALFAGYFVGKNWVQSYLRGPEFRRFVNARIGKTLQSEVEFEPFQFNGMTIYSDSMTAHGLEGGPFSQMRIEQLRAEFSLRRFFDRVWQVESVEAQHVGIKLDGTRLSRPPEPEKLDAIAKQNTSGWLPNRVEIASAVIHDFELTWGDLPSTAGSLSKLMVRATPSDGGWLIEGSKGELRAANLPALQVANLRLRQRDRTLFVNTADFLADNGGSVKASGEVVFGERVDLQGKLEGIDIEPLLSNDWRLRLHGRIRGDVRVQSSLPSSGPTAVTGSIELQDGRLEALPFLNEVATFTGSQQFRSLALTRASAHFERTAKETRVTDFVAESEGLIRMEGSFVIATGQIDGTFQVGVSPTTLQWLPGSRDRVFTVARDGYVWTSMRLTGPVDSPNEDLSSRLVAAAGNAVIEKVESAARDALQLGRDAAKSALDLLLPKGQ
jgi:hypothetical protein